LVGTYQLAPNFLIHVSKAEGHLFAQAAGQERFEIFLESDRDFFSRLSMLS
jgi:hypothetical protein